MTPDEAIIAHWKRTHDELFPGIPFKTPTAREVSMLVALRRKIPSYDKFPPGHSLNPEELW